MSNLQNLCRNCGRDLGNDQQSLALGACSGVCARAISVGLARCGHQFLDGDMRAVCSLPPEHAGLHKSPMGFEWGQHAEHAAWNNIKIRQPNGPVPAGKYLSAEELAELAGEGGNADASLGRAIESVGKAVQEYDAMIKTVDSTIANEMLGRPVDAPKPKTCACCQKVIGHANPHAVFCSSMCAGKAAEAYKAQKPAVGPTITGSFTFGRAEIATAADRALSFVAGLNLQDHSVKEQREALEVVRALQTALRPERMRSEAMLGRLRDEEARQKSVRVEKDSEKNKRYGQNLTKPTCFGTK